MPRPGPNVTSDADTQPGSDSLFPTGFSGGGALVRSGSVGTGELADGSVASADLNLSSVATALAARGEFTGTYASLIGNPMANLSVAGFKQMAAWRAAALSARSGSTARVAFYGDSITFGFGADTSRETENLCRVWRDMLAIGTGLPVFEGMAPANSDNAAGATKRSFWTAGTGWSIAAGYGIGGHGAQSATSTATGTLDFGPFTCDGFTVKYMRRASTATFDIWVNGGTHSTVGSAGADAIQTATISATLGSNTLHIGSVGAGAQGAIILGVEPTITTGGVKVANFGVPSVTASTAAGSSTAWAPLLVAFDDWQPHLTVIGLGTNDYLAASNRTPTQLQADITTIITKAKTYGSVLLWIEPERTDIANVNTSYTWAQYAAAQKAAAAAANVPILDLAGLWGGTVASARGGAYNSDGVHPSSEGHASIASALYRVLVPA